MTTDCREESVWPLLMKCYAGFMEQSKKVSLCSALHNTPIRLVQLVSAYCHGSRTNFKSFVYLSKIAWMKELMSHSLSNVYFR